MTYKEYKEEVESMNIPSQNIELYRQSTNDCIQNLIDKVIACPSEYEDDEGNAGCLQLTIGFNDDMSEWGAQTGDNSYMGPAYSFPHWSVVYITPDSTVDEIQDDIIEQALSLITQ